MATAKTQAIPSVLAFARSINPGHMAMFSSAKEKPGTLTPVTVRAEPLRGLNATMKTEEAKKNEAVLQVVESAELAAGDDTLVLRGKLLVRNNLSKPFACNDSTFEATHGQVVQNAVDAGQVIELARRYAVNLFSGTWGWRNALEADSITVTVRWEADGKSFGAEIVDFIPDANDRFNLAHLSPLDLTSLEDVANAIANALTGQGRGTLFRIEGRFFMGEGARVYPSQEWASESEQKRSKIEWGAEGSGITRTLAKIRNAAGEPQAIINDRKAGNALRVVDTWYDGETAEPIAAEIYGANSHKGVALRTKNSFFDMLKKVIAKQALAPNEAMYYLAVCVRGGVLGGKE